MKIVEGGICLGGRAGLELRNVDVPPAGRENSPDLLGQGVWRGTPAKPAHYAKRTMGGHSAKRERHIGSLRTLYSATYFIE